MKKATFIYLLSVCIGIHAADVLAQSDLRANEKTIAYIKQFRSDYTKSILEKTPKSIQSYYGDSIRLMPEFQKTIMGKSNALLYQQAFGNRFDSQDFTADALEIHDLGSMVVEVGAFTQKITVKQTDKRYELKGKYINIWRKTVQNKLELIAEAWNYNHPLEIDLKFKEVPESDVALQSHVPINSPIRFELAALNRLMEVTVSQHDQNVWAQFYTDDGMFCYTAHPMVKGKKELNDFLIDHYKNLPIFEKLDIRNDRIDHLGTYIIEYASHIALVKNGDWSGVGTGKDLRIWRREKDGSLKIFRHIAMYD